MDFLIIGAGEMGRWFGATALEHVDGLELAFADLDTTVAADAAAAVGGRTVPLGGEEQFDAVGVAVPMSSAEDAIANGSDRATEAITDVTGAMEPAVSAMRSAAPNLERLSIHPLFAAENAPGNVALVPDRSGPTTDRLRSGLVKAGNRVFETTPVAHDRAMQTVQAKAHAAIMAFAIAADPVPPEYGTPVFEALSEVTGMVTGNDPGVYAEIQATFDGADEVAAAARRVADATGDDFEALYRSATVPVEGPFEGSATGTHPGSDDAGPPGK